MEQRARNLTDRVDGGLRTARQLIHDRDPVYTKALGEILTSAAVRSMVKDSSVRIVAGSF